MAVKRTCDNCGNEKKMTKGKTGGAICLSDHFICSSCQKKGFFRIIISLLNPITYIDPFAYKYKKKCPVCSSKFRKINKDDIVEYK